MLLLFLSVNLLTFVVKCEDIVDEGDKPIAEEKEKLYDKDVVQTQYKETVFETQDDPRNAGNNYPTNELVYLKGGTFTMGTDSSITKEDGEGPSRKVTISPFKIDKYEVSYGEFNEFIAKTKYITEVRLSLQCIL